jgi:hypothetical protein
MHEREPNVRTTCCSRSWARILARYREPSCARSMFELVITALQLVPPLDPNVGPSQRRAMPPPCPRRYYTCQLRRDEARVPIVASPSCLAIGDRASMTPPRASVWRGTVCPPSDLVGSEPVFCTLNAESAPSNIDSQRTEYMREDCHAIGYDRR